MEKLNKNSIGLALGFFFGLGHLVWVLLVGMGLAKPFMDWVLSLHFLTLSYSLTSFNLGTGLMLVVFTFVCGYALGWVFAAIWNAFKK